MAIAFARVRYLRRAVGDSAVRTAAYNARERIRSERTGEVFYFRDRETPEHHAVLLPEGADARFSDAVVLWNAAEAAERRRDSQVAREIVLALPANAELTAEDRIALARSFAEAHFVSRGLAVQLDIHAPDAGAQESERANWHAHLLITTRRVGRDGFAATKARDVDPAIRRIAGRGRVVDGDAWGELWRAHQDQYFREQGLETRVDPTGLVSQIHVGPRRMRRATSDIVERAMALRQANQEATYDPRQVLEKLTRNNATFTERDLDRFLVKQLGDDLDDADIAAIRSAVLASPELVALYDRETSRASGRYTTRDVRDQERAVIAAAAQLANQTSGRVTADSAAAATAARTLRPDQMQAFEYATGAGHLKLIEGRAGTGKSYTLSAIRDAYERDGKRVIGLAPTNAVAQDMAADGFGEAGTLHSALFRVKNGLTRWDRNTVVMVDEAAMLGAQITGELLAAAGAAGAKLILVGDDRQLASIERGGLFTEFLQRHGSAEITEVTRQQADWPRQAARDLEEYRFGDAVGAFERAGAITWRENQDEARAALVAAWKRDSAADPDEKRFVFAYTNRDVDALNAELRQVRRERGELVGQDVPLVTRRGDPDAANGEQVRQADFAVGDRVQFTKTAKAQRIYNGNIGTITAINPLTGEVTAKLDAAGREGRDVSWNANEFQGFQHGYAGTIYKGQGRTLDRTYLYHSRHWTSAPSYVALTRQRKSAEMFVARETAQNIGQLAQQMAQNDIRHASLAWAAHDELARDTIADHANAPALPDQAPAGLAQNHSAAPGTAAPADAVQVANVADGRARFRERYAAHQQEQQAAAARHQQARDLIEKWNQRIQRYRAILPAFSHDTNYPEARDQLVAFARSLREQPDLVTLLRAHSSEPIPTEPATLQRLLDNPDPAQAIAAILREAEHAQRTEHQQRDEATLQNHRLDERTRNSIRE